ncbi:MAG: DHHA1 domain-containing protein [Nanoarchaeota archaeon]|nr:DHHA1 domain-containing protein [Nanoarchaeota archaeon]
MKGLTEEELESIRKELRQCKKPLFFYDDDADGVTSFLLLYRWVKEGKGIIVKSKPTVDESFARKVEELDPDKVFVLDMAVMTEEFVAACHRPIIWIDHHQPLRLDNVKYFNPRKHVSDIVYPTSNICYDIVQQDLWLAMVGCVGDWHLPYFTKEFCKQYPDLLNADVKNPDDALFDSKIGKLVHIVSFLLKGDTKEVKKCVEMLGKVQSPYEILNQETDAGKYLVKKYEALSHDYRKLLQEAKKKAGKGKLLVFAYNDDRMSFTSELSNELLHIHPDKLVIIARKKDGSMRMSLRCSWANIPPMLDKALSGLQGRGGGHEHACGADVAAEQFDEFLQRLEKLADEEKK